MTADDLRHLNHALTLAARGLGRVWPNPAVGCVVVKDGRIVGRGRTADGGRPHAETVALAQAGTLARGATAYVTLEPCAHVGQTRPCTNALIAAGIARVVAPLHDPDRRVAGQGFAALRSAGVEVVEAGGPNSLREMQRGFLSRVTLGRPMLTLKLAATIDGRIATATGESRWITGPDARRAVHAMRMCHDAVLVGAGTARADNPTLTVRDIGCDRQPVRIVVSRHLNLPWPNRLAETIDQGPVWLVHGKGDDLANADLWAKAGATLIPVATTNGHVSPSELLAALGARGLTRVFCEGGGSLAASLFTADLVDELVMFTAGKAIGAEGQPSVGAMGIASLADAPDFALVDVRRIGNDAMLRFQRPD